MLGLHVGVYLAHLGEHLGAELAILVAELLDFLAALLLTLTDAVLLVADDPLGVTYLLQLHFKVLDLDGELVLLASRQRRIISDLVVNGVKDRSRSLAAGLQLLLLEVHELEFLNLVIVYHVVLLHGSDHLVTVFN